MEPSEVNITIHTKKLMGSDSSPQSSFPELLTTRSVTPSLEKVPNQQWPT